ncbi:MAG: phenylalanine--tRNA ligase subunit beta [Euryarchaeota archaeon]|nr:phenylalanine--tRNA ligase subunit beta [Euryarchaeota archaeon]
MPVIEIDVRDLKSLLGKDVSLERITEAIPLMGAEMEEVGDTKIRVEFFPNRPDLYSVEGVARALKGLLGLEKGAPDCPCSPSGIDVKVDPSVNDVRPFIVCGVVKNVGVSDPLIRSLMDLQEKLHLTLGRKRRKVAIGVHDMARLKAPFVYRGAAPDEVRFVPLGKSEAMSLHEILQRHEKGVDYASILAGFPRYPVIEDANGQVLSFPPIINGTLTEVNESTRDIFLDVTGTNMRALDVALNVLTYVLKDRGGSVESVNVSYPDRAIVRPDLSTPEMRLSLPWALGIIGMHADARAAQNALERMRYGAEIQGDEITVWIPPYRSDILHPIDIVEDLAIGLGYGRLPSLLLTASTFGSVRGIEQLSDMAVAALIGYGYLEVTTLTLSNEIEQARAPRFGCNALTKITNPASEESDCLRISLLPSLMGVLKGNKHRHLPQRLFEVGDVARDHLNTRLCAGVSMHPEASFTEGKALVLGLARDLGLGPMELKKRSEPMFMDGRCASILVSGFEAGVIGEANPEVISGYGLSNPIVAFELDLSGVNKFISKHMDTSKT